VREPVLSLESIAKTGCTAEWDNRAFKVEVSGRFSCRPLNKGIKTPRASAIVVN
jgi:hypothetical protein